MTRFCVWPDGSCRIAGPSELLRCFLRDEVALLEGVVPGVAEGMIDAFREVFTRDLIELPADAEFHCQLDAADPAQWLALAALRKHAVAKGAYEEDAAAMTEIRATVAELKFSESTPVLAAGLSSQPVQENDMSGLNFTPTLLAAAEQDLQALLARDAFLRERTVTVQETFAPRFEALAKEARAPILAAAAGRPVRTNYLARDVTAAFEELDQMLFPETDAHELAEVTGTVETFETCQG